MKLSDLRNLIRESFNESLSQNLKEEEEVFGSKDMVQQNLNNITLSLEAIQENIDYDQVEDWVDDKIAKISREMSNLKDYYTGKNSNKEQNDLEDSRKYLEGEEEKEIEESLGLSQTIKKGENINPYGSVSEK
jgi:hypothetical protein